MPDYSKHWLLMRNCELFSVVVEQMLPDLDAFIGSASKPVAKDAFATVKDSE